MTGNEAAWCHLQCGRFSLTFAHWHMLQHQCCELSPLHICYSQLHADIIRVNATTLRICYSHCYNEVKLYCIAGIFVGTNFCCIREMTNNHENLNESTIRGIKKTYLQKLLRKRNARSLRMRSRAYQCIKI